MSLDRSGVDPLSDQAPQLYASVGGDRLAAMALPRKAYVDPRIFDAEVEQVLRTGWLLHRYLKPRFA